MTYFTHNPASWESTDMNAEILWSKENITQRDLVKSRHTTPWCFWFQQGKSSQGTVSQRKTMAHTLAHVEKVKLIKRESSVYAIGSCFARNIEEHLIAKSISVLSRGIDLPGNIYSVPARPNAILNQYSTPSILSLLSKKEAVLEPVQVMKNGFAIPCASAIKLLDEEVAGNVVSAMRLNFSRIDSADCVILTLGQNESWYDHELELYWNAMPPAPLLERYPNRFSVRCHNFQSNFENVSAIISRLIGSNSRVKIVLTVSPVPLRVTFSGEDALVANEYNKSVLRVIAEELSRLHDNVVYFPSYEMVRHTIPGNAYHPDFLHVKDELVGEVVRVFLEAHVE